MSKNKNKTLVLGASEKEERYSNKAIHRLQAHQYEIIAIGKKTGNVSGTEIITQPLKTDDVDTVTMYLSQENQRPYYDYIFSLSPRRIIFNPGSENDELAQMAKAKGIKVQEACTLVLLGTGQY